MSRVLRRVFATMAWLALALAALGWALFLRPQALGGSTTMVVVHGNSMLPDYRSGDLVVLRPAPTYQVGEVIAYRVPRGQIGSGAVVIHRIIGGAATTGFVVKGDNNPAPDPWHPTQADVIGGLLWHVPGVGSVLATLRTPATMGALAAALAAAMVIAWKPRRRRKRLADPAPAR